MISFLSSDNVILIAMLAGLLCIILSNAIEDLFTVLVFKESLLGRQKMIAKYIALGCFGSIFSGFIFYAFTNNDPSPIRSILTYSFILGVFAPISANLLLFAYRKLFPKHQNG